MTILLHPAIPVLCDTFGGALSCEEITESLETILSYAAERLYLENSITHVAVAGEQAVVAELDQDPGLERAALGRSQKNHKLEALGPWAMALDQTGPSPCPAGHSEWKGRGPDHTGSVFGG